MLPIPTTEEMRKVFGSQELRELEIVYAEYGRDMAISSFLERYIQLRMQVSTLAHDMHDAWGVIANAGGGNWDNETKEWQAAAIRWRDDHFGAHVLTMPTAPRPGDPDYEPR